LQRRNQVGRAKKFQHSKTDHGVGKARALMAQALFTHKRATMHVALPPSKMSIEWQTCFLALAVTSPSFTQIPQNGLGSAHQTRACIHTSAPEEQFAAMRLDFPKLSKLVAIMVKQAKERMEDEKLTSLNHDISLYFD
jgi:hypothetical protein